MIFKAKPKIMNFEQEYYDMLIERMDDEGFVHGYYADGYIVGEFVEVTGDYVELEFWVPIQEETLRKVEEENE